IALRAANGGRGRRGTVKQRLGLVLALGVLGLLGLCYIQRNDPEAGGSYFPRCMFREITGLHCAGCGGTRATHALTNLEAGVAFRKNPLLVILLPFLVVGVVLESAAWVIGEGYRGPRVRLPGQLAWSLPVIIIGFCILRNIPGWPFELLAPR
ncbi:MAG: DUF2752 domain-containing protein, partial [Roseibacillus sp.]|nr:DUF2752 domain-containing protein [Roseibacillus sp.]